MGSFAAKQRLKLSSRRRTLTALLNVGGTELTTLLAYLSIGENCRAKPKVSWVDNVVIALAALTKANLKLNPKEH
jgi:hypothetical protein